ncbi:MAG TPA: hypothetical protein VJB60_01555 [Candidatus Peribacterales bacterium]|nr:hypothetical protein [Candidatus Peribacterales bacterium]
MNTPETSTAPIDAATVINRVVEKRTDGGGRTTAGDIERDVEQASVILSKEEQEAAQRYIGELQQLERDTVIETLESGVGGLYDGSTRKVAADSLTISSEPSGESLVMAQEADAHEKRHEQGDHTGAYQTYEGPSDSSAFVVLGGQEFDQRELIEGRTIEDDQFVSDEYHSIRSKFLAAVQASGHSEAEVQVAIDNSHDLTKIDDRAEEPEGQETPLAVGA